MRADSPRLPGGGGTSVPSSGGGHVGPDHVIRRRNAPGVKVHGRGLRADPSQEIAALLRGNNLLGPPPPAPPTALRTLRPILGCPLVHPTTPRSVSLLARPGLLVCARGPRAAPSMSAFPGRRHRHSRSSAGPIAAKAHFVTASSLL